MANRHKKHKAEGGKVRPYNAQGSNVEKEAEEKKDGGKVARKEGGPVEGKKCGGRLDKRARGGRAGSDKNPFSSAKAEWSNPAKMKHG